MILSLRGKKDCIVEKIFCQLPSIVKKDVSIFSKDNKENLKFRKISIKDRENVNLCFTSRYIFEEHTVYVMELSKSMNGNESNENNTRHFNKRKILKCIKTNCKVQYNFDMGIRQTKEKVLCIYAH